MSETLWCLQCGGPHPINERCKPTLWPVCPDGRPIRGHGKGKYAADCRECRQRQREAANAAKPEELCSNS